MQEQADCEARSRCSSPAAYCSIPHSTPYIPSPPQDLYYPQPYSFSSEYLPSLTSVPQPSQLGPPIGTLHRLSISNTSDFLPYPSMSVDYLPHAPPPPRPPSRRASATFITSTSSTSSLPLPPSALPKLSRAVARTAAKALKEATKGRLTFVNYTSADHKALLRAVAPSGTIQRSRTAEGKEDRKRSRSLSD
jgi:hypothetical protein